MSTARPQLTPLLANRDLDRLARLRIGAARRFTNRSRGEHLAAKGGTSTEFCDYRDYSPGDDTRFIDWNIFSRLHRPYLKQFHLEEELHVAVLLDVSSSMQFGEKFERARQLAAVFGVLGLRAGERVSVHLVGADAPHRRLRPATGRSAMMPLFHFLEKVEAGGQQPIERGIETFLKNHTGRGVAVILSDFLSGGDLKRAFSLLFGSGLEPLALQILSPAELDPDVSGDLRLVDSETSAALDISSAAALLDLYHEYREAHQQQLAQWCSQRSGRFQTVNSATSLEHIAFDQLRRTGWII